MPLRAGLVRAGAALLLLGGRARARTLRWVLAESTSSPPRCSPPPALHHGPGGMHSSGMPRISASGPTVPACVVKPWPDCRWRSLGGGPSRRAGAGVRLVLRAPVGVYLAMLTLAFAQIVWSVAFQWDGGDRAAATGWSGVWPAGWLADKLAYTG